MRPFGRQPENTARPRLQFRSPGDFNEGMVDIVINPEAEHDSTVLLFGDSFFRMMLKHMSAVFSKVICLRTWFYHPEMVELIQPDCIFSGNAERYLSAVAPDSEAAPFFLYSQFRNAGDLSADPKFLGAYRAMTSPASNYAKEYFKRLTRS